MTQMAEQKTVVLPCRMGEEAYGIRLYGRSPCIIRGKITEMKFSDDMELMIRVKGTCAGRWGEIVFENYEDARRALDGVGCDVV